MSETQKTYLRKQQNVALTYSLQVEADYSTLSKAALQEFVERMNSNYAQTLMHDAIRTTMETIGKSIGRTVPEVYRVPTPTFDIYIMGLLDSATTTQTNENTSPQKLPISGVIR